MHFSERDINGRAAEMAYVKEMLSKNGYPESFVQKVIKEKNFASVRSREETVWVAAPYVNGISEAIARVLRPLGISLAHSSASWQWSICKGLGYDYDASNCRPCFRSAV